jgi:hypothetical protein
MPSNDGRRIDRAMQRLDRGTGLHYDVGMKRSRSVVSGTRWGGLTCLQPAHGG